jgi:hypothetical protein
MTDGQSVIHPSGTGDQFFFILIIFRVSDLLMWCALCDETLGLWFSDPAGPLQQSLSRIWIPHDLMSIFHCLYFWDSPTWRARSTYLYPPGAGWPSYTPGNWVWNNKWEREIESWQVSLGDPLLIVFVDLRGWPYRKRCLLSSYPWKRMLPSNGLIYYIIYINKNVTVRLFMT